MSETWKYSVNSRGEDLMLVALKKRAVADIGFYLEQGHDPFVPSPFGQCCAGFGLNQEIKKYIPKLKPFDYKKWVLRSDLWMFDLSANRKSFRLDTVHTTNSRLAYTLPYLSGIHLAAATNHLQAIHDLRDQANKLDAFGYLPIVYAMGNFNQEALNALKSLQSDSYMPLQGAYLVPYYGIVAAAFYEFPAGLAKRFNVIPVPPTKSAVSKAQTIHQAAALGDLYTLNTLIRLGVDVNIKSYNGSTALICSVLYGQLEACELLLKAGANPNLYNYLDETPTWLLRQIGEKQKGWPIFSGQNSEVLKRRKFDVNIIKKFFKLFGISFSKPVDVRKSEPESENSISDEAIDDNSTKSDQATDDNISISGEVVEDNDGISVDAVDNNSISDEVTGDNNNIYPDDSENTELENIEFDRTSTSIIIGGILSSAIKGDFQLMVSYVLTLTEDNRQKLPADMLSRIRAESKQDTELIEAWLIINTNCQIKEFENFGTKDFPIDLEQIVKTNQPTYQLLKWIKDGHSLSVEGKLLSFAASYANTDLFHWLLRLGVAEPPKRISSEFYSHLLDQTVDSRKTFIDNIPTLINDELLFAVTTGNVELLLDYIDYGFDWEKGVTRYNLNISQIMDLKPNEKISRVISHLKVGKSVDEIRRDMCPSEETLEQGQSETKDKYEELDVGNLEDDFDDEVLVDFGELDYPKENTIIKNNNEEVELKTNVNVDVKENSEKLEENEKNVTEIYYGYLGKILLNVDINNPKLFDTLSTIFHPPFMVKLFFRAQNCISEEELMTLVDNDNVTLELFRAMKLYADDKFSNVDV